MPCSLQAHTPGEVEESGLGVSLGPHPGGKLRGLAWGVSRPTLRGVSRPTPRRGIPACTEADTPSRWLLLRAVRILLECFYVIKCLCMFIDINTYWFQKKHSWIKDSNITFKSSIQITTITIYMHNLSLKRIHWSFESLNLLISNCSLATGYLNIHDHFSSESDSDFYDSLKVTIDDSSLGYMRTRNVSQIIIKNSNITGRNEESSSSFFVIHNSNITISDSIFANNSIKFNSTEPTLLNASINSNITFVNCIVSGNTGYASIIQVINQSFLRLIDSDFSYNKIFNESMDPKRAEERSIVRINDSSISVVSSNFTHNELVSPEVGGSVMFISYYSKIEYLEGCFFAKNKGTSLYTLAFPGGKLIIVILLKIILREV